jgi:cytoskeletal protein RodZ
MSKSSDTPAPPDLDKPDQVASNKIGDLLQKKREQLGFTLDQVADATKISKSNLRALETQDFKALPADTFTRGLLTIYAALLKLNPKTLVDDFFEERNQQQPELGRKRRQQQKIRPLVDKELAEPAHVSPAVVAITLLITIIVFFTLFCLLTSWNPFHSLLEDKSDDLSLQMHAPLQEQAQASLQHASRQESDIPTTSAPPSLTANAENEPTGNVTNAMQGDFLYNLHLHFLIDGEGRIKIDDQEETPLVFTQGNKQSFQATKKITLHLPGPSSAEITLNELRLDHPQENNGNYILHIPDDLLDQ